MTRTLTIVITLVASSAALGACGAGASSPSTTTTVPPSTTVASAGVAHNLVASAAVRTSLLDAGAAYHGLAPSDYVGLDPKMTYYAFDSSTHRYYAAAGLDPSPHSLQAQISAQDDGGYNLFTRTSAARPWRVYNDGLGGADGSTCPLIIPEAVLKVWHWALGGCYPPLD